MNIGTLIIEWFVGLAEYAHQGIFAKFPNGPDGITLTALDLKFPDSPPPDFSTLMQEIDDWSGGRRDRPMKLDLGDLPLTDAPMPEVSNVVVFTGGRRSLGMALPDGDDDELA
jgi:hypothetical protein